MDTELVELFESAKKAADAAALNGAAPGDPEVDRCLDVLGRLKSFPVTYDVLVSTQVAKKLRPLRKHPTEKIHRMVTDVLNIWKQIIVDEASNNKNGGSSKNTETKTVKVEVQRNTSIKVEKVSRSASFKTEINSEDNLKSSTLSRSASVKVEKKLETADGVKTEKMDWSKTVKAEKISKEERGNGHKPDSNKADACNNFKVEKIQEEEKLASTTKKALPSNAPPRLSSLLKCNDPNRDKVRENILEALSKVPREVSDDMKAAVDACDPMRVSVALESVMFEKMGKSVGAQKVKYRSIMFNLKDSKNPDLRRKVLLGYILPEVLVQMSPEEMASDERQAEINKMRDKALFECERAAAPKATTDQFKCGRCQQRKTTYFQLQTRSADEPMTTFVTCVNCNNHWKFC